MNLLKNLHN